MKILKTFPLLLLLVSMSCAARNPLTIARPNARTVLEERAYNLLKVSERIITTAEECRAKPPEVCAVADFMVPIINGLIDAHNLADTAAKFYVAVLDAGTTPDQALIIELENFLFAVDGLVTRVVSGGGQ